MNILVTGGAGFIGSHVCRVLLERGDSLVCVDNFDDYYDPEIKQRNVARLNDFAEFIMKEGNVCWDGVPHLLLKFSIDAVIHLAALPGVRASVKRPFDYYETNLMGTLNILEAMKEAGITRMVFASTSSVYGNQATTSTPLVETTPTDNPLAPYPASKRAAELLCHAYYHQFGIQSTCLRFFNVYGPAGRPDMMPYKVIDAITNDKEITLFDGGDMWRDWTYIDDIVYGVVAALDNPLGYEIINLGRGKSERMSDFVTICENIIGKRAIVKDVPAPKTEPKVTYCDNSKARRLLGFEPAVDLPEGLYKTWEWYRGM